MKKTPIVIFVVFALLAMTLCSCMLANRTQYTDYPGDVPWMTEEGEVECGTLPSIADLINPAVKDELKLSPELLSALGVVPQSPPEDFKFPEGFTVPEGFTLPEGLTLPEGVTLPFPPATEPLPTEPITSPIYVDPPKPPVTVINLPEIVGISDQYRVLVEDPSSVVKGEIYFNRVANTFKLSWAHGDDAGVIYRGEYVEDESFVVLLIKTAGGTDGPLSACFRKDGLRDGHESLIMDYSLSDQLGVLPMDDIPDKTVFLSAYVNENICDRAKYDIDGDGNIEIVELLGSSAEPDVVTLRAYNENGRLVAFTRTRIGTMNFRSFIFSVSNNKLVVEASTVGGFPKRQIYYIRVHLGEIYLTEQDLDPT